MFWLKLMLSISFVITGDMSFANSDADAAINANAYSGAQDESWAKAQNDVQTAKIKYDNDKKQVETLKATADLQESLSKDMLAKINEAAKALKISEANYFRLLGQYNLRYPEKGLSKRRLYERQKAEPENIDRTEAKAQTIDDKLQNLNRNLKRQYLSQKNATSVSGTPKVNAEKTKNNSLSNSNDVTDTIKLEK